MGKASRDKGGRRERQVVKLLRDLGLKAERVPLSGAAGGDFSGDVKVWFPRMDEDLNIEVKGRAGAEGWKVIKKWLGENAGLVLVEDGQAPLVVLPWWMFQYLIVEALDGQGSDA